MDEFELKRVAYEVARLRVHFKALKKVLIDQGVMTQNDFEKAFADISNRELHTLLDDSYKRLKEPQASGGAISWVPGKST